MRQQASWIPRVMFLLDPQSCSFSLQYSASSNRRDRPSHPDWTQPLSTPPWRRGAWKRLVRWPHTRRRTAHTARSTGLQMGELVQSVPPTCHPRQIVTNAPATPPWTPCCWSINSGISMAFVCISQLLSHHTAPSSLSFELEEILKFGGGLSVQGLPSSSNSHSHVGGWAAMSQESCWEITRDALVFPVLPTGLHRSELTPYQEQQVIKQLIPTSLASFMALSKYEEFFSFQMTNAKLVSIYTFQSRGYQTLPWLLFLENHFSEKFSGCRFYPDSLLCQTALLQNK